MSTVLGKVWICARTASNPSILLASLTKHDVRAQCLCAVVSNSPHDKNTSTGPDASQPITSLTQLIRSKSYFLDTLCRARSDDLITECLLVVFIMLPGPDNHSYWPVISLFLLLSQPRLFARMVTLSLPGVLRSEQIIDDIPWFWQETNAADLWINQQLSYLYVYPRGRHEEIFLRLQTPKCIPGKTWSVLAEIRSHDDNPSLLYPSCPSHYSRLFHRLQRKIDLPPAGAHSPPMILELNHSLL